MINESVSTRRRRAKANWNNHRFDDFPAILGTFLCGDHMELTEIERLTLHEAQRLNNDFGMGQRKPVTMQQLANKGFCKPVYSRGKIVNWDLTEKGKRWKDTSQPSTKPSMSLAKNNTSGYKGVSWHSQSKTWRASIFTRGERKHLGVFSTAEEAYAAYLEALAGKG